MQTFKVAKDANIQKRKTCKHAKAENLQICKGAKDANTQRRKTCQHAKARIMQT